MIRYIVEWIEVLFELSTLWGRSLMSNENDGTAEVMAGEEGPKG